MTGSGAGMGGSAGKGGLKGWILLVVAVALLSVLGACSRKEPVVAHEEEGKPFPVLTLTGLDGGSLSTRAFRGKVLVLNVWASWCPPCRKEMPSLERLSKMLDPKRFAVIGLSVDEDRHLVREFLMQNGITFPNYLDPGLKIVKQTLGIKAYPETFIVAPGGELIRRVMGEQAWDSPGMLQVLEDAYKGKRTTSGTWAYGGSQPQQ